MSKIYQKKLFAYFGVAPFYRYDTTRLRLMRVVNLCVPQNHPKTNNTGYMYYSTPSYAMKHILVSIHIFWFNFSIHQEQQLTRNRVINLPKQQLSSVLRAWYHNESVHILKHCYIYTRVNDSITPQCQVILKWYSWTKIPSSQKNSKLWRANPPSCFFWYSTPSPPPIEYGHFVLTS